jgi:hypothetical protein
VRTPDRVFDYAAAALLHDITRPHRHLAVPAWKIEHISGLAEA